MLVKVLHQWAIPGMLQLTGIVQIASLLLSILPKPDIAGTLLTAAFIGGGTATHPRASATYLSNSCHTAITLDIAFHRSLN